MQSTPCGCALLQLAAGAPLGLLAPGYAADLLLTDPSSWTVNQVWCAGRKLK